jgi:hypothetical protein
MFACSMQSWIRAFVEMLCSSVLVVMFCDIVECHCISDISSFSCWDDGFNISLLYRWITGFVMAFIGSFLSMTVVSNI